MAAKLEGRLKKLEAALRQHLGTAVLFAPAPDASECELAEFERDFEQARAKVGRVLVIDEFGLFPEQPGAFEVIGTFQSYRAACNTPQP